MTGMATRELWFTSTTSSEMTGQRSPTFDGLYMCELDQTTGKCLEAQLVVDKVELNGQHHRGLDLMNVVIDEQERFFYTGYFSGERGSWEILRASYDSTPILLESFFRTTQMVWNSENILKCPDNGSHTYFQVEPRSFVLDGGDVFVSWEGFYQDCRNRFGSKVGLLWTIGVSKIKKSQDCILNEGLKPVNFEDCTVPVSIVYQDTTARQVMHGYSGIAVSRSPSGMRVFFLSILGRSSIDGAWSEIWTMPEGEDYSKNPKASGRFAHVHVSESFLDHPVDNVGTIRLRLDANNIPSAACRSSYNDGVHCYALQVQTDGTFIAKEEKQYVHRHHLEERCTVKSSHFPITDVLPPMATGLEVLWDDNSPDEMPTMLFFGCYGEITGLGNFTTVLADGNIRETVHGAHPGSIVFGKRVQPQSVPHGDYLPPAMDINKTRSNGGSLVCYLVAFAAVATLAAVLYSKRSKQRKISVRYDNYHLIQDFELEQTGLQVELA